ncbi:unnamed protein product [Effrenium voratum]|uniref:Solute carrier family 35 member F2 n=1 Tax=Effrenium voratum TaxID=2562239 RepID=A0AA36NIY0_9DINO|nr:unnamed protein product [Effrenium voratum]CAJ1408769.1 unnamed protein product [Effrenium voratum]|mmetsp:Transcript_129181/g.306565  ORF Transcript_129181/g.306565 Transcript_129181/m.306565 type:complete len:351 (-) Transcript_129181:36-1088(-)
MGAGTNPLEEVCLLQPRLLKMGDSGDALVCNSDPEMQSTHCSRILSRSAAVKALMLGQVISIFNTFTGVFSSTLADSGINLPTTQSSLNYLMLAPFICGELSRIRAEGLRLPWWRYAIWALADVEANYMVVLAYRYTSVASVMLLDGFTVPGAMLISRLLLGACYRKGHVAACVVCLCGLSLTVFSDSLSKGKAASAASNAWVGDVFVLCGASLYSLSNVQEELLLKRHCSRSEALGMLGIFGSLISCVQAFVLESRQLISISWSWADLGYLLGFQLSLFGIYVLTSIFLQISDAAVFNMSLLTCDVYSILFSWQVQHKQISWIYGVAFLLTLSGLLWYHRQPAPVERPF